MNHKETYHVIGLMSGTSLDGLDIAYCIFNYDRASGKWRYEIKAAACLDYNAGRKALLHGAHRLSGLDLMVLHGQYGHFLGQAVNDFIKANQPLVKPDFIASHGHTIFHDPARALSFQLGDGAAIHAASGLPVVCDFRSVDVSLGGQGAPLVPVGDALLFSEFDFCLNLGGIANISYQKSDRRLAYDICGCNLLLNLLANEKSFPYDKGGMLASKGHINPELLEKLNAWSYLHLPSPKSLDKDTMLAELVPVIESFEISTEDKLATVSEHIAIQIADATRLAGLQNPNPKMLCTGGGALNDHLIQTIRQKAQGLDCVVPDETTIQYKEALVFAFLGVLRMRGEVNSLASVTGAREDSVGVAVYGI
jgi:anhydro-N-acetylmuramic acid kinase